MTAPDYIKIRVAGFSSAGGKTMASKAIIWIVYGELVVHVGAYVMEALDALWIL